MLQLAITCLVIALVAALLGFGGIAGSFVGIAKIVFFVFLIFAVLSFLAGGFRRRPFCGVTQDLLSSAAIGRSRDEFAPTAGHTSRPLAPWSRVFATNVPMNTQESRKGIYHEQRNRSLGRVRMARPPFAF